MAPVSATTASHSGAAPNIAKTRNANFVASASATFCLITLIARYNDPGMAYEVKRRRGQAFVNVYRYDEYEQLSRIKEWLTQEAEEDFR